MNKEEIKIITLGDIFENIETEEKAFRFKDYVKNLQDGNERLNNIINELIEYGENCLDNLKDQEDYVCESVDIVSLLKMIHHNYIDKLKEIKENK